MTNPATGPADRLIDVYDALLLDLDGTVYRGAEAVDGAAHVVDVAHERGVAVRFLTNNASRAPGTVAEHLSALGIPARHDEVATSAQAAAGVLAAKLPEGSTVLVVGTEALVDELIARGLVPVREASAEVAAVVQGFSPELGWRDLAEAALAIQSGALWVACNVDRTLPTERGLVPGNGSMVAAIERATGATPIVAGKPARALMDDALRSTNAATPLVVGDRLDTDIAGAVAVAIDALLVLSGVSTPADVLAAPPTARPRYLAADILGALCPAADVEIGPHPAWSVELLDDRLQVRSTVASGCPDGHADPLVLLRALCATWWRHGSGRVPVDPADAVAARVLTELDLPLE